jgi:general stress protein 26
MASTLKTTEDPKAHLVRLVKDFNNAMLISKNASDQLRGRPMRIAQADVEQNLWFITTMDSAKIEELLRDPRACVTMQKGTTPPLLFFQTLLRMIADGGARTVPGRW